MDSVYLVVDQYMRFKQAQQQGLKIDPSHEAQALSLLIKPLARHDHRVAIVAEEDDKGLTAYHAAGYEVLTVNGNRPTELRRFIKKMNNLLDTSPPTHMVLVTTDPMFELVCNRATRSGETSIAVWAPAKLVPSELSDPDYGYRPLEELLPELRVRRLVVFLDYENLHIGLEQQGRPTDAQTVIEAIKAEVADLGEVVNIVAYADWTVLARGTSRDLQRELAACGADPRYQMSMRGKNSADMKLADEIRTLLEKEPDAPDGAEVIVLVTRDRDFRPLIETAKSRGRSVVLLTLKDGLSQELLQVAPTVKYLDHRLPVLSRRSPTQPTSSVPAAHADFADLAMDSEAWRQEQEWKWIGLERFQARLASNPYKASRLQSAIDAGVFVQHPQTIRHADGSESQVNALVLNREHPTAQSTIHFLDWVTARIDYCLNRKGMPWVDTNFLAKGMAMDSTFQRLNVGQTRSDAERWLNLGAECRVIGKRTQPHPQSPGKLITTWWLKENHKGQDGTAAQVRCDETKCTLAGVQPPETATPPKPLESGTLRQLVMEALSDDEITTLAFDHFRPAHDRFSAGMSKTMKVQVMVEHVERQAQVGKLQEWIRQLNPTFYAAFMGQTNAA